jgi:hypothetical protein
MKALVRDTSSFNLPHVAEFCASGVTLTSTQHGAFCLPAQQLQIHPFLLITACILAPVCAVYGLTRGWDWARGRLKNG